MMNLVWTIKDLLHNSTGGAVSLPDWAVIGGGFAVIGPLIIKLLSLLPWGKLVEKLQAVLRPACYGVGVAVSVWLVKVFGKFGVSIEEFFETNIPRAVGLLWGWFVAGLNSDDLPAKPVVTDKK